MDFRKVVFTLGFIAAMALAGTLGYVNNHLLKLSKEKDLEIAGLHLRLAESEGKRLGPHLVEAMVSKEGEVLVRIDGNNAFIYGFPGLCFKPGYNGNL